MSLIKKVWNGFVAIIMFFYLVLVLLLGKIIGLSHLHKGYWSWLRKVICQNGPIWVKIAQWVSNRPDLCNPVIAEELSSLREHCPIHSWKLSKEIFKKETNTDITHFLDHVETKPFASGSIGQVYKGVLDLNKLSSFTNKNTTDDQKADKVNVVIKIQHPDLDIKMKWFFVFVKWWNKFFSFIRLNKFQIPISTEDMETHLLSQLDYKQEAENMELARKNFADNPHVIIPEVY